MSRSAYEQIKESGKLPSPSGVALELIRLADDPKATIEQISRVVESDPAVAGRVLKLVNSTYVGAGRTVASVSLAVRLLGLRSVRNIALGVAFLSSSRRGISQAFDYDHFWRESLGRAAAARHLTDLFHACPTDEAFTIALLSRIGRLALASVFPSEYDELLGRLREQPSLELCDLERGAFGIDHNELTAEMLADWRIATVYCEAIRRQDAAVVGPADDRVARVARLLRLSEAVARLLTQTAVCREDLLELVRTAERAGVATDDFSARFDTINLEWPRLAAVFSISGRSAPSLGEVHTRASREHRKVLVVDDDRAHARLIAKYLEDAGYEVETAADGAEAFECIREEHIQLVVADRNMPVMDGLQLCRALRQSDDVGFVYIIILTGDNDLASLAAAFEAGADDFVAKPCTREELLSRLKAGVRAAASEMQIASQQLALRKANAELAAANQTLQQLATTDELTGLYNRREALRRLGEYWAAGDRHGQPLACMMLDIDHFKRCNDTYGHEVGDAVLRAVGQILARAARKGEAVFRIGGEEFLVICPEASADTAAIGAERIRAAVAAEKIRCGGLTLSVTISIGVAGRTESTTGADALLKRADEALYAAKQAGRNRVCVARAHATCPTEFGGRPVAGAPVAWPHGAQSRPTTVLVADDAPEARRLFRELLGREGFHVIDASDGIEALDTARAAGPDVIVMDAHLPGMDGIECTRQIKADPTLNGCPIILVSGCADDADIEAGLRAGAEEFVAKPVRHNEFVLRVQSLARLHRGRAELFACNAARGEQARAMTILFELSRVLAGAEGVDGVVTAIVTATAELLNSCRVSLLLPDESGGNLRVAGAVGMPDELVRSIRVQPGEAIAGRVFATGVAVVCNSPGEAPRSLERYGSDFFASIPLASRALAVSNKPLGVLNVTERFDRRPFMPHELEYLDLICNLAASALDQIRATEARERAHEAIVFGLARLAEYRDADTGRHLERVTQFALLLAEELRTRPEYAGVIDERFLEALRRAMPLHDIGKVSVPDAILLKPGALTPAQFAVLKRHPEVGANAIQAVIERSPEARFLEVARDVAHYHHERYDGSGYPAGLAGENIPLAARIAAVADVYDALRTRRPYKEGLPHERALEMIRNASGRHFDPQVVGALLRRERDFAELALKLADNECDSDPGRAEFDVVCAGI